MFLLEGGMTLHPLSVGIVFGILTLLALSTLLSMVKQRKKGLAALMFVSVVVLGFTAYITTTVPAS